jgi:uncharacterized protein (DUF1697 family)
VTTYVALLRAVNVGGTTKLPMIELKEICHNIGFAKVRTYIASGNVVFDSKDTAVKVKSLLETALHKHAGKPIGVLVRTAAEIKAVAKANPFAGQSATFTVAIFLNAKPPADALRHATGIADEAMKLGKREIFVHYPSGQGRSKLRIPAAKDGTARNMNTVVKLAEMASE